ncbi:MAG: hypothetical protein JHC32_07130 [Candidatus Aminicenantes bacterium]|nr:hypothetical protein [Candidatus Aminicenantes bacterium]
MLAGEIACQLESSQPMRNTALEKMNKRLRFNFSPEETERAFDQYFCRIFTAG